MPPPYPRHPSEHRCWHRAPCALSRPPGVAALAELGLPLGFHDLPFCAECKPHPHPQSTGLQARAFPINSDAWSISSEDGWAGLSTDSLERRLLWGLRQWKRREPLPARKALPCARPAVRACRRPRRTLLSDDSRLSGCGADSSFRSDGAGAAAAGAVPSPGQAGRSGRRWLPPLPRREGRASLAGGFRGSGLPPEPLRPRARVLSRPCGQGAEGCQPGGAGEAGGARSLGWGPEPRGVNPVCCCPRARTASGPSGRGPP